MTPARRLYSCSRMCNRSLIIIPESDDEAQAGIYSHSKFCNFDNCIDEAPPIGDVAPLPEQGSDSGRAGPLKSMSEYNVVKLQLLVRWLRMYGQMHFARQVCNHRVIYIYIQLSCFSGGANSIKEFGLERVDV